MANPAASNWATVAATASPSATSNGALRALMPSAASCAQAASQASIDRSLMTTSAPAIPRPRAMAKPNPLPAPVTSATRPARPNVWSR
ncbi:hypothetical protein G6F22_022040 [Rhizopus arrhizus]|uniref:Uncharacterized protein n=1 Tax=Rhizopus delemar TaxID=936053 RepID=A0A9P7BYI4_9FUNG|nr:hypothetical protein G6F22_022040 [Rhizopus arrhizus]KAG1523075.1 hypothetical protein G6F50_018640 [Rhizopus delemar]